MSTDFQTGTQGLIDAIQHLSLARDLETIQSVVRGTARRLTGADGATFVLRDGDCCYYADEDAIEPLWKGQRFPLEACISGWSMLNREPTAIPDIYLDDRIPHDAYRPTFVKSLVMVPIRTIDPIGAIGNYWASHHAATSDEIGILQALANAISVAMENIAVHDELERIAERTAELAAANEELAALTLTDELTGLRNRRGFTILADQELKVLRRAGEPATLVFIDVDGLKDLNDTCGHDAGDELLQLVATGLRRCVRDADLVARLAGDEFALFLADAVDPVEAIEDRVRSAIAGAGVDRRGRQPEVSIGAIHIAPADDRDLETLLRSADARMYEDKHRRRQTADT